MRTHLKDQINQMQEAGLFKDERPLTSSQNIRVNTQTANNVLNLCSNNYLGLAQHPEVNQAAQKGLKDWGYGMASVRFICGTQILHKELEEKLSQFLEMEDTILYPSCFDANAGLFETLLNESDAIISDELNHASIIDGVRLCKAKRYRYKHNDIHDLERQLQQADKDGARYKLITTDGVFSMDGDIARLDEICNLADKYHALVHFDDCHATGFVGKRGKGTHEYKNCMDKVDIITGTLGKALGGASGGFTSAHREIVSLLRQRSRPYLFSNTVAPCVVAGALKAIEIASTSDNLRDRLQKNTHKFRQGLSELGFDIIPGQHPIIAVLLYDATIAKRITEYLFTQGIYVVPFSYPVVPKDKARIRIQVSASLTEDDIVSSLVAFKEAKNLL